MPEELLSLGGVFDSIKNSNLENKDILERSLSAEITKLNEESKGRKEANRDLERKFEEFQSRFNPLLEKNEVKDPKELLDVYSEKDKTFEQMKKDMKSFEEKMNEWENKATEAEKKEMIAKHESAIVSIMNETEYGKDDFDYNKRALLGMSKLTDDGVYVGEQKIAEFLQERIDKNPKIKGVKEESDTPQRPKDVYSKEELSNLTREEYKANPEKIQRTKEFLGQQTT